MKDDGEKRGGRKRKTIRVRGLGFGGEVAPFNSLVIHITILVLILVIGFGIFVFSLPSNAVGALGECWV